MEKEYKKNQEFDEFEEEFEEHGFGSKVKGIFGSFMSFIGFTSKEEEEEDDSQEEQETPPILLKSNENKTVLSKYGRNSELFESDEKRPEKRHEAQTMPKIVSIAAEQKHEIVFHFSRNVFDNEVIADYLSQGKTCIIRFSDEDMGDFETSYNYLLGAKRAMKGDVKKIDDFLYVFAPNPSVVIPASEKMNLSYRKSEEFHIKIMDVANYHAKQEIVQYIKANVPVIIRLENCQDVEIENLILTRRDLFEFVKGALYINDSKIAKLYDNVYLFSPKDVKVMETKPQKLVVNDKKVTGWDF